MKKLDLKEKKVEDMTKLLVEKREELRTLRFSKVSREKKDFSGLKKLRADIARILTELGNRATESKTA